MERQLFEERFNAQNSELDYDDLKSEIKRLMNTESVFIGNGTLNLIGCIEECSELIELLSLVIAPREAVLEETADVIIASYVLEEFAGIVQEPVDSILRYDDRKAVGTLAICQANITKVLRGKRDKEILGKTAKSMRSVAVYMCKKYCFLDEEIDKAINVKLELFKTMKSFK